MDIETYQSISQSLQAPDTRNPILRKKIEKLRRHYNLVDATLYFQSQENRPMRRVIRDTEKDTILHHLHTAPFGAHQGAKTMYQKANERYFWPTMKQDVTRYVKTCDACQRTGKPRRSRPLHPLAVPQEPFDIVEMDYIGPLPQTNKEHRYIWVAIDYLTKWVEARPAFHATAGETARFIYEDIICRHGCPKKIISDNGTHFANQEIAELLKHYGIKQVFSTAYHPQTNGLVERMNGTIKRALSKFAAKKERNWNEHLPAVLFAIRTSVQESIRMSPFQMTYGRKPRLPIEQELSTAPESRQVMDTELSIITRATAITVQQEALWGKARQNLRQAQDRQKIRHDDDIQIYLEPFSIGDKVLLHDPTKTGSMDTKWKGYYYIHDVRANDTYKLRAQDGKVLKNWIHSQRLKAYFE
jgi:hypothetical protein